MYTYIYIYMYIYSESPTEKYCFTHDGNKTIGKKRQVCSRPKEKPQETVLSITTDEPSIKWFRVKR